MSFIAIIIVLIMLVGCSNVTPDVKLNATVSQFEIGSPTAQLTRNNISYTSTITPVMSLETPQPGTVKATQLRSTITAQIGTPFSETLIRITTDNASKIVQYDQAQFSSWALVTALAWSPDGDFIVVAAGDSLLILDPSSLKVLSDLPIGSLTHALTFSPNGSLFASGSRDGLLRVWESTSLSNSNVSKAPIYILEAHKKGVSSISFSSDGSMLASSGIDAVARFWNPAGGELIGSVIGGTFAIPAVAFTPGEKDLALINGNIVRLRNAESERILGTFLASNSLYSLAIDPEANLLAVGGTDHLIRLWRLEQAFRSGQEDYPDPIILDAHEGNPDSYQELIWQVAFSPDGDVLASAGGDSTIRLWNLSSGSLVNTLEISPPTTITCLAFSPDGQIMASGGLDGVLRLWKVNQ